MARSVFSFFDVAPRRIGGQECFARELSRQLSRHGWNSILCFNSLPGPSVRQFLESPNVTLEALDLRHRPIAGLRALVRRYRPEIVHLYYVGFLNPYAWTARLSGAKRVFFTDQGSQPVGYVPARAPLWKRLTARAITWPVERVIANSDYNARAAVTRGTYPAARILRIYNAIDPTQPCGDPARFRSRFGIPAGRQVVLQVSWIIPEKGIPDLIDAAGQVLARNRNAHFVFVGEGAYRRDYTEECRKRGLADHVTWAGLLENPVAEGAYAAADVVCQVSRWQEAFGWTIAEAMGCRRPLVATRVGGIPEVVADGQTGFLVPPGRPDEIAAKVLALLDDAGLRRRMGEAGRRRAAEKFDLETNVAELLRLYGIGNE